MQTLSSLENLQFDEILLYNIRLHGSLKFWESSLVTPENFTNQNRIGQSKI